MAPLQTELQMAGRGGEHASDSDRDEHAYPLSPLSARVRWQGQAHTLESTTASHRQACFISRSFMAANCRWLVSWRQAFSTDVPARGKH